MITGDAKNGIFSADFNDIPKLQISPACSAAPHANTSSGGIEQSASQSKNELTCERIFGILRHPPHKII